MQKFQFTEEQIEFIKKNWGKVSAHAMKKKFNCSWYAVVNEAVSLGFEAPTTNYWTDEEIENLKELSKTRHYSIIAKKLGKTENAVYLKAKKLGITLIQDRREWTKEEEKILKKEWGNKKIEALAKKMHRSVISLKIKANRMQLGPMILNNMDALLISDISELFGISEDIVRNSWISKGLKITQVSVSKNKSYMSVTIEDLMEFLRKNQDIWDSKKLEENIFGEEPDWLKEKRKNDKEKGYTTYAFWTEEEKERAKFWIQQGKSYAFISERVNHSPNAVKIFLQKEGYAYYLSKFWKPKDIKFVRENMNTLSKEELANKLGRSVKAIELMISDLSYHVFVYEPHEWTEEENEYLKTFYKTIPNYELANSIGDGVSKEVLIEQLKKLGIYRIYQREWLEEEDLFIKENYKELSMESMAILFDVSTYILRRHLIELGLYEKREVYEWTEEENEYLKKNYKKISNRKLTEHFQVSNKTLIRQLETLGIYIKQERHNWTEEENEYLKCFYKKISDEELRKHFGIHQQTLIRQLKNLGIYQKRWHEWTEEEDQFLINNYKKGMKSQLMGEFHVSSKKFSLHLKELGIQEDRKFSPLEINEARKQLLFVFKNLLEERKDNSFSR